MRGFKSLLLRHLYRGLVKWYYSGLQNHQWGFDSLIPCQYKEPSSGRSAVWQRIWFGTRGPRVQILPPRPLIRKGTHLFLSGQSLIVRGMSPLKKIWAYSSGGQSGRLISVRSMVRVHLSPPLSIILNILWAFSSVGQSARLITGRSKVRVLEGPPCAQIAQSVEQETENLRVRGSIPRLGTIFKNRLTNNKCYDNLLKLSYEQQPRKKEIKKVLDKLKQK